MSLIGRQPICDAQYTIVGYDILFRDEAIITDSSDISISVSVLDRILNGFGIDNVLGGHLGFLKVDMDFLKSDIVTTIPQKDFILMILENSLFHPELETTLQRLSKLGYRFGINGCIPTLEVVDRIKRLHVWLEYVRIDTLQNIYGDSSFKQLKEMNQKLIAMKVESLESFEEYKKYGSDFFQGYYIKRPYTIENDRLSSSQEQVLGVWNLLQQDAEIGVIVPKIEQNHALVLQLMQFINSSYFSFKTAITSVQKVIALIGRKALSNWLLLMLAANKSSDTPTNHPLLLMVINRTEIISGLLKLGKPNSNRDEMDTAYLVGMLSLIHLFLNMNHREFLRKLNVSPEIEEAMFEAQGKWGELLTMTRHVENMDIDSLTPFIHRYKIDIQQMNQLVVHAMEKVNAFDTMLQNQF